MQTKHTLAVVIGRFSPFHKGHQYLIDQAFAVAENVLVLIGSANIPITAKNPFTWRERARMIQRAQPEERHGKLLCQPLEDFPYDENAWIAQVQRIVGEWSTGKSSIVLVGHIKDQSSYYLKCFPQWAFHSINVLTDSRPMMDATRVRELLFKAEWPFLESAVPPNVYDYLRQWANTPDFARMQREFEFVAKYKKQWENTPYPVNFVATDAVVVQSGHVLLIRRKSAPGEGLLALPGGYVDPGERLVDACVRELYEETQIAIPEFQLRRTIVAERMFDDPGRNLHGRVMTMAYLCRLDDTKPLANVSGKHDVDEGVDDALWLPIGQLDSAQLYSDHKHVIRAMLQMDRPR